MVNLKEISVAQFPGQGSQKPGMGKYWHDNFKEAQLCFEEANDTLAYDLKSICFQESQSEKLNDTEYTQPALLCNSIAIFKTLQNHSELQPKYFLGHSLGEFSALCAMGVINFKEALKLVQKRAQLMKQACPSGVGSMAALIFKNPEENNQETAQKLCDLAFKETEKQCHLANFNSPAQIVISGYKEAIVYAVQQAKELGIRRAIELNVSGPFHSPLMQPAAAEFKSHLEEVNWELKHAHYFIPNVTAKLTVVSELQKSDLVEYLEKQLYSCVQWKPSLEQLPKSTSFLEIGSGLVLSGLCKKTLSSDNTFLNTQSLEQETFS